jgi:hypothetical protein
MIPMVINNSSKEEMADAAIDSGKERRDATRFVCNSPVRASFVCKEGALSACVDNFSETGAKLRVQYTNPRLPFLIQGEFDYTFHGKESVRQCRGKTAWVQRVGEDFAWGIEFIHPKECFDDPFKMSIGVTDAPLIWPRTG